MGNWIMENQRERISGLRILITGGTTGIGRETAQQLTAFGANVLICGTEQEHLEQALSDVRSNDGNGVLNGVIADLSTDAGIAKLFEEADSLFGGQLDVLINNVAVAYQSVGQGTYNDWKRVIDTNLLGYIACSKMALDRMIKGVAPQIIMIGSMSADVREPGSSIYVATKAAIQGFAESLRKEINESGVRVTLIEPGAVDTDMQGQDTAKKQEDVAAHRMLEAADIASAVIYTLSQDERCDVVEIRLRPRMQLI